MMTLGQYGIPEKLTDNQQATLEAREIAKNGGAMYASVDEMMAAIEGKQSALQIQQGETTGVFMPSGTESRVCALIAQRQALGINKYGTTVADNPLSLKEWLRHALEEALDQAVYLARAIEELEK